MRRLRNLAPIAVLAALGLTASASASASDFDQFKSCPTTNPAATKCLHVVVSGGEVVLGARKMPTTGQTVLQGGISAPDSSGVNTLIAPAHAPVFAADPVTVIDLGPLSVKARVELAGSAEAIKLNQLALAFEEGTAISMPIKVHLESPLLGRNCYVGSNQNPIVWNLTDGTTAPPPPNQPIKGFGGEGEFLEEGTILQINNSIFVDNAWAVPAASGCGHAFHRLADGLVNAALGLPSPARRNSVVLSQVTTDIATVAAVVSHH